MTTETQRRVQRLDVACFVLALLGGLLAGRIDFNATEPQPAALIVLVSAAVIGFLQPRHAWRWAIIVGLGVPLAYLIFPQFGLFPRLQPEPGPGPYATLIALIPAFIGAYGGVLVRRVIQTARP